MQDIGCLGLVHWNDSERWYGEEGGRGVQIWEHVYTHDGFMLMYGKTNTSKIKLKKKEQAPAPQKKSKHDLSSRNR